MKKRLLFLFSLFTILVQAQHHNRIMADVDYASKTITVRQDITYFNQTEDTLSKIILNDWVNAYSSKTSPLARRFSDEFVKSFHLAKDEDRGSTTIANVVDQNGLFLTWSRPDKHPDIVTIHLKNPIYPNHKFTISLTYTVKIPNNRFTHFGYDEKEGKWYLKDWYLTPARFENGNFVVYSNENIDDIANAACNYEVTLTLPKGLSVTTDLHNANKTDKGTTDEYYLRGNNRMNFELVLEQQNSFETFGFKGVQVNCNLKDQNISGIERAAIISKVVSYTSENLGKFPNEKLLVTQTNYDRNPVYGLNQLPSFLRPFPDSFIYEIRFLKTYLEAYLKASLKLDPRKDNWIYDAIEMELIIKYIQANHPDMKMMGSLGEWGILKGYNIFSIKVNDQYDYVYLLMARRNQDQPIGDKKNTFLKFNAQIAGKYKAGLSLDYLDNYLGNNTIAKSIKQFYSLNTDNLQVSREDFEQILKTNSNKNINWFFTTMVQSRDIIDYKFKEVDKKGDSLQITIKNKTGTSVPIPLYGLKDDKVIFKYWLNDVDKDSTFTIPRNNADRLALNYNNEVPEYNRRNNWYNLKTFAFNKPVKGTLLRDIENPKYNQFFYVPNFVFNLYDGVSPGLKINNKSIIEKPFIFDLTPTYSVKTKQLIGSYYLMYNQYIRDGELYNIRYSTSGSTYHYAPDARYIKFTPAIQFRMRDENLRSNKREFITLRYVSVNREKSAFLATEQQNENYSVFNAAYSKYENEITRYYGFNTDVQIANAFGKLSGELQFRRLFNDNRQINLRFYAGMFMYRDTQSEYFSFGLDRPTDYLFDYNFYGRSEATGIMSQQFILAEGGFKSILDTRYANQWMTTVNGSFNIWNWVEVYGDAGLFKNKYNSARFVYDSGIRLNLLPDYFELYFPVYSSNGLEFENGDYSKKIRFVVTISPNTLINLFTRKWF
ncbi:gluzincin family metallopeptidase [Flavobacterium rhizosphaerae]|uniref:Aminopeptidase n=1 Tax=Flavobacterium rhizosphaerae TaxID=3163298 RepID=A0ABW8YYQ5_9FLAO